MLSYAELEAYVLQFNPQRYAKTRNFLNGGVSGLSPYISRGVISTRQVYELLLKAGHEPAAMEKFIQELAWRDYWQLRWQDNPQAIAPLAVRAGLASSQRVGLPNALLTATTTINAIDAGITTLYETGRMHNHLRMYTAALACSVAQCHWLAPAQWMYYHLLDADWGSNALSWQWVNGDINGKKYYANQENINYYSGGAQRGTFLDVSYDDFPSLPIPAVLKDTQPFEAATVLPNTTMLTRDIHTPCFIYTFYNLDPNWHANEAGERLLLLEPSVFAEYPVSPKTLQWVIEYAHQLIPHLQVLVCEFNELAPRLHGPVYFKEHPLQAYRGTEETRDWLAPLSGFYPSFFAYWKRAKKYVM